MVSFRVLAKKIFSVSLVFNALLTIGCTIGILAGYYWYYHDWQPFSPFLVSGALFWVAIAAAAINIFPSAGIGRALHTGRFLFHHYLYGLLVLVCAAFYVVFFTPVSLLTLFFVDNTSVAVNVGRFFVLGGFTLLLDDLPDVHTSVESALNWLKAKVLQAGRFISLIQLVCGAVSFYIFVAITIGMYYNPQWVTLANFILIGTLFITSLTSFIFVKKRVWLKITD
ncbi:MAG: hypothetical protein NWE95_01415 [Candidatus Bathyarchaeota archaeon]|nr:hypothetical protein [Candidatus Bathyarchaeota archaeon]